ncbi:hypothetical protein HanIR_Chr10g0468701 [Helianthus annuus]|nr:hypothetical protein HanIR_Chr10g0468701 [Helianthus annuus]
MASIIRRAQRFMEITGRNCDTPAILSQHRTSATRVAAHDVPTILSFSSILPSVKSCKLVIIMFACKLHNIPIFKTHSQTFHLISHTQNRIHPLRIPFLNF